MKKLSLGICIVCIVGAIYVYWQNNSLVISMYEYRNQQIAIEFEGFKIVQLSDLHNHSFGDKQQQLVEQVNRINPDIIVFTGDIIDSYRTNFQNAYDAVEELQKLAPVYYTVGNHEARIMAYPEFEQGLLKRGVHVLRNEIALLERGDATISLIGLDDADFFGNDELGLKRGMVTKLNQLQAAVNSNFYVLLSHRPDYFEWYISESVPLTLSGHAHGGQVRVPFTDGLFAPGQGFFPSYTSGMHTQEESTLIISRGLGNSIFPIRVQNRPEIVVVTLHR